MASPGKPSGSAVVAAISLRRLPRGFYDRNAIDVAPELLGRALVHVVEGIERVAIIVEVEAYLGPHDLAAHSARGRTLRTEVMFGPPGFAYVYLIYGLHHCMNVVTGPGKHASAVLIRAVEPVAPLVSRASGPGLVCRALGIDRSDNGLDLLGQRLYIGEGLGDRGFRVERRPRIGVDYAGHWARRLLRFYIRGNAFISRP
jgi:DNA-3-methyladenine glycosylase